MKNKGFTLIELLAVIVILAIIALIATPVVLGIIEDSRENAEVNSAQFMIDGVQTAYAVSYTKSYENKPSGSEPLLDNIIAEIDFKNATPVKGKVTVEGKEYDGIVVTSSDKAVKCSFAVINGELTSDDCGKEGKIEKVKIGKIGTSTEPTQTEPTQTEPTS